MDNKINEPLVSVIVPIYKVEKYLDDCVRSIVNQSYQNLEIILIDDGSPDKCPQMCDNWKAQDARIIVIHKENEGLGMARNTGLDIAKGTFVYFLDSDDYLLLNAIQQLVEVAIKENADIVGSGLYRIDDKGNQKVHYIPAEYRVYREDEINQIFIPDIIAPNPQTGHSIKFGTSIAGPLFSMQTILKAKWRCQSEREILSEDIYSFLDLGNSIRCAVEVPIFTAYYRCNPTSLSKTYREDRFFRNVDFYIKLCDLIKGKKYERYIGNRIARPFLNNTIECLKQVINSKTANTQKRVMLNEILDNEILIKAISQYNFHQEKITWKLLFYCIKKRWKTITCFLIKMKS